MPDSESKACVDRDVSCVTCGYNLRGLQEDGRCPECGEKVCDTLQNVLVMADRKLILGLRETVTIEAVGRTAFPVFLILGVLVEFNMTILVAVAIPLVILGLRFQGGLNKFAGQSEKLLEFKSSLVNSGVVILILMVVFGFLHLKFGTRMYAVEWWLLAMIPFYHEAATCSIAGRIARAGGDTRLNRIASMTYIITLLAILFTGIVMLLCQISEFNLLGLRLTVLWDNLGYIAAVFGIVFGIIVILNTIIFWRLRRMLQPFCVAY